jgi:Hemerythrin HHE cation binding domain
VHDAQRRVTTILVDALSSLSAPTSTVGEVRDFVGAMLDHHHRSEDTDLWPLLIGRAPALTDALAALSREHDQTRRGSSRVGRGTGRKWLACPSCQVLQQLGDRMLATGRVTAHQVDDVVADMRHGRRGLVGYTPILVVARGRRPPGFRLAGRGYRAS